MSNTWNHVKTIPDGQPFSIKRLNIWDYSWKNTGQQVEVIDHAYGETHLFMVYEITHNNVTIRFAAGEFSNGIWGIYQKAESAD